MFHVFRLGDSCPANYYVSSISFIDSPDTALSRMSLQSWSLFTLQASEGTSPPSMLYFLFIIYGRYTHQKLVLSPFIQLPHDAFCPNLTLPPAHFFSGHTPTSNMLMTCFWFLARRLHCYCNCGLLTSGVGLYLHTCGPRSPITCISCLLFGSLYITRLTQCTPHFHAPVYWCCPF
jgi:hypothetical protein